jgi:Dynein light chain type 1
MSDRKAVIKNADMGEEMQQDAVDCATQALEKYNIEKVRAIVLFDKLPSDAGLTLKKLVVAMNRDIYSCILLKAIKCVIRGGDVLIIY